METDARLDELFRLNPLQKVGLERLSLKTVSDLMLYLPSRYEAQGERKKVSELTVGDNAVIYGKVLSTKVTKAFRKKIPFSEAIIEDETGKIKALWFHQAYMAKKLVEGASVELRGKVTERPGRTGKGELYLANPEVAGAAGWQAAKESLFYQADEELTKAHNLIPVYPETRGLSSGWFYYHIKQLLDQGYAEHLAEPLPTEILTKYHLPEITKAVFWIHNPKKIENTIAARKRFAFEEVLLIQLNRLKQKESYQANPAYRLKVDKLAVREFLSRFPFEPTLAQMKAINQILDDFSRDKPMVRLLEGDVGSGKTAVAATTAYAIVSAGLEVAYMAPTEILAKQHFESFIKYFEHLGVQVGLLTSSECRKFPSKINPREHTKISKSQLLKWVANGDIPIVIGTHALIQKQVKFKKLAYTIIDEQHRFGVMQRARLVNRTYTEQRRTNAENERGNKLLYEDLTYRIREALFNIKKALGSGHKEIVYQKALEEEFSRLKIKFDKEKSIPIHYNTKKVGTYRPDFVIEDKIIVELKALPFIGSQEKSQLWNYLKGSKYNLALLVNFGYKELQIERIIYEEARDSAFVPHSSASVPHLLSMTATPIPRTLALTVYGDLDLTVLDEMPAGRKPIITKIITPDKRADCYEFMREQIEKGRQVYVICPRIDEPDPNKELALQTKSVKAEAGRLAKEIFPDLEIGLLHSKLRPAEKEETMDEFAAGNIDILVATSVVEVGVNVPNATIILIEGAERFGLAQLHQLRGRVLRSTHQAYCFLFSETKSQKSLERLKALITAKSGFELAELDLGLRGAGTITGEKQWGLSDLGMEAIKNVKMVEAARAEARELLTEDPELNHHPLLKEKVKPTQIRHFE